MKNILLILTITLSCFTAQAQIQKGTFQFGIGGLPVIYPFNSVETGYSLRANVGYFIKDNMALGLTPFYGKVAGIESVGANIYFRWYFMDKPTSIFMEAAAGFGRLDYKYSPRLNGTMNVLNLGPGVQHKFKNKFAVEFLVQYANLRNISNPRETLTGHTIIPTLGIQYFMER